jgi:protein phosphatase
MAPLLDASTAIVRCKDTTDRNASATWEPRSAAELFQRGFLFVVCDGIASDSGLLAASAIVEQYSASLRMDPADALESAIRAAGSAIHARGQVNARLRGLGATCAAAILLPRAKPPEGFDLFVGHVGDVRAYLFRGHQLTRLTTDHTLVSRMIAAGTLTPDAERTHPDRDILVNVLGVTAVSEPDRFHCHCIVGDILILATDGLTKLASDAELEIVLGSHDSASRIASELASLAERKDRLEDVTVQVVRVLAVPSALGVT